MKREFLKGIAVALALTAVATTAINAQPANADRKAKMEQQREPREEVTPEQRATKITEAMTRKLKLSDVQSKKLYKVNLDYINKLLESKKLKSQHNLQVLEILDADQSVEFMDMLLKQGERKQQRGGRQQMRGGEEQRRPEGGRPERRRPAPEKECDQSPEQE